MYEIEKGVPIPEVPKGTGRRAIYPFASMEVGDSFLVPGKTTKTFAGRTWRAERVTGYKFTTRTEGDSCRVWRVK